jgi:hypothetical protein
MIEKYKVYPITVLTKLSYAQKQILLQNGIMLCADIVKNPQSLQTLGLPGNKAFATLNEATLLCAHGV